ncbi:DNA topoisomerase 3-alpha, partial [Borealophlyctis nickersoniae]
MTALVGHLMESDFPPQYKSWKSVPPNFLFDAPIYKEIKADLRDIADNLRREARHAHTLAIWTDCDREGENIGAEVVQVCRESNPNINVKRARFSVIQEREIKHAWNSLGNLDVRQAAAVDARSELDLRIGAAFTRFQSLRLAGRFLELAEQKILSYGTCQFPTLGFVVERALKIQNFVPEDFWKIEVSVRKDDVTAKFNWDRGHLFDHHFAVVLYERCMDNPTARVVSVQSRPKSRWAPLPLTTVEMQKVGSRSLHLSSDRIMTIAESLYTKGIISYPRTETDVFSDNFQLRPLIEAQTHDPQWGQYAQGLLDGKFKKPRKGKNNDEAHPPIHPVRAAADLAGDDKRVYDFITRRFLACCSDAAKGQETTVTIDIAQETFTAKGLMILERNWLEVYPFEKWSDSYIPVFVQGDQFQPSELNLNQGRTSGPELLTEADLIGLMEKSGIGTDATIHEHIKKILERSYVNKEGPKSYFVPTVLGLSLVQAYDAMNLELSLAKPELRSQMEANMKKICEGTKTKEQVVHETIDMYRQAFAAAEAKSHLLEEVRSALSFSPISSSTDEWSAVVGEKPGSSTRRRTGSYLVSHAEKLALIINQRDLQAPENEEAPEDVRKCPKCGSLMMLRSIRNGEMKMIGCMNYPRCKHSFFIPKFAKSVSVADSKCQRCSTAGSDVRELDFEFIRSMIPPMLPTKYRTCLWCDEMLRELIEADRPVRSQPREPEAPARQASARQPRAQQAPAPSARQPDHNQHPPFDGGDDRGDVPNCQCGTPAARRMVRKEGPNSGREFYACRKHSTEVSRCDFFQWADEPPRTNSGAGGGGPSGGGGGSTTADPSVQCHCGEPGALRTVKKDGPNFGREFYGCGKGGPDRGGCDYFQWADQVTKADPQGDFAKYQAFATFGNSGNNDAPKCGCGLISVVKTAGRNSENQ